MTQRDLTSIPSVTNVTPDVSAGVTENAVAQGGQAIIKAQQQSLIVKNFSQAYMDLNNERSKMQTEYQSDPMAGIEAYKEKRQQIIDQYGSQVSPFFRGQWNMQAKDMGMRDDMEMNSWAYYQARQNAQDNINQTMQNHFQQANQDGANYGAGKTTDLDALMNYAPAEASLQKFGLQNLGAEKTGQMMKAYPTAYLKSFMSGVIETNPKKAAELLQNPVFADRLSLAEKNEFGDLIAKTVKTNDLITTLQTTKNTQAVTNLINDPHQTFFQKRLALDQLAQSGGISEKTAKDARRLLTDKNAVDTVTDTPTMANLITRMYDLNAQAGLNAKDYLTGVQGLHDDILAAQAGGKLNASDVRKMNDEMRTITANKLSNASMSVSYSLGDAGAKFKALPPEWRGEATRQLFYMTNGQKDKLTPQAYDNLLTTSTQKVIDDINAQRRKTAINATQPQLSDDDFLKKIGATQSELEFTAKQHNMTVQQVIEQLKKRGGE